MRSSRAPSHVLQGPRPTPLATSTNSGKIAKINKRQAPPPVVVYLRSPKIIHVRPEEFMSLVQELTGNRSCSSDSRACFNHERRVVQNGKTSTTSAKNKFQGGEIIEVPMRISSSGSDDHDQYSSGYILDIQLS